VRQQVAVDFLADHVRAFGPRDVIVLGAPVVEGEQPIPGVALAGRGAGDAGTQVQTQDLRLWRRGGCVCMLALYTGNHQGWEGP
jgi:hypothetical protein